MPLRSARKGAIEHARVMSARSSSPSGAISIASRSARRSTWHTCLLVLNRTLAGLPVARRKGADAISVPLRLTRLADERRDFMAVLMGAISLK